MPDKLDSVSESVPHEALNPQRTFERFFTPFTEEFKETVAGLVGRKLLEEGEKLGFKYYQPKDEFDPHFNFSFAAVFGSRLLQVTLRHPEKDEKKQGWKSSVQIDFVLFDTFVKRLTEEEKAGVFDANGRDFQLQEQDYLEQNAGIGQDTLSFVKASLRLLDSVDDKTLIKGKASDAKRFGAYASIFQKHFGNKPNFRLYQP